MRLNKYLAQSTGISRREADRMISAGNVTVNGKPATLGQLVTENDTVRLKGETVSLPKTFTYLLVNKPVGYVSTRNSQDGTPTIYELLPDKYQPLKYVGRLDKNSSGALLLTDDGDFAHKMTHPKFGKEKTYEVTLDGALNQKQLNQLSKGVELEDGISKLSVSKLPSPKSQPTIPKYKVTMHEGRNRQIRRTFASLGRTVVSLNRTKFGPYELSDLKPGEFIEVKKSKI